MAATHQTYGDGVSLSVEALINTSKILNANLHHHKDIRTSQSGNLLSKIKGHGIDFDEIREYQWGDDIRRIDWKTSAKLQKTYSKTYKEERERPILLLVDFSPTMFFGTKAAFKSIVAAHFATLVGYLATAHQDRVGAVIYSQNSHLECKPKAGKAGIQALIKSLVLIHHQAYYQPQINQQNQGKIGLVEGLKRLKRIIKPGSLLFVISDFYNLDEAAKSLLQQIGKHNDIVLNFIFDNLEKTAPKKGEYWVNDGSNHRLLDTTKSSQIQRYQHLFADKQHELLTFCQQNHQSLISIKTNADLAQILFDSLNVFKK